MPDELIWDHDLNVYARSLEDPFLLGDHLRSFGHPLLFTKGATRGLVGWVPTSFKIMDEIFMDTGSFSSVGNVGVAEMLGMSIGSLPIDIDPPQHRAYRTVLMPILGPGPVAKLEPMVRRICLELIGEFEHKGECDLMNDFASPFPSYVFLELTGLPKDMLPQFFEWEHAFIRGSSYESRVKALKNISDYLWSYIEMRRQGAIPSRDDFIGAILNSRIAGSLLTKDEIMGLSITFYTGGLDTVISSLGWHMHYIAEHPELQEELRANPDLISSTVDDLYRAFGVTTTRRYVTRDMEFHGIKLNTGDRIHMPTHVASRDPAVFPDPHRVDPRRRSRGLTFASGIHACAGMHLARREVRYVLEEFLKRFRNIRIASGKKPRWQTNGTWAFDYLPLTWDA